MSEDTTYFKIPIPLLTAFNSSSIRDVLNDSVRYTLYERAILLDNGTLISRYKQAANQFHVKLKSSSDINFAERVYKKVERNAPFAQLSRHKLWEFIDDFKSPDEIASLLAFLAIKSILQKQDYALITNDYLLSRMSGFSNNVSKELHNDFVKSYHSRWKLDKLKDDLQENWYVKMYGIGTRGFYISIKVELIELIEMVEKQKIKNKSSSIKSEKKVLIDAVKRQIKLNEMTSTITAPSNTITAPSQHHDQHHDQHHNQHL